MHVNSGFRFTTLNCHKLRLSPTNDETSELHTAMFEPLTLLEIQNNFFFSKSPISKSNFLILNYMSSDNVKIK